MNTAKLNKMRKQIDQIDSKVMSLLEKRFRLLPQILTYKNKITDRKREQEILGKTSSAQVKEVYKTIFKSAKKLMRSIK